MVDSRTGAGKIPNEPGTLAGAREQGNAQELL